MGRHGARRAAETTTGRTGLRSSGPTIEELSYALQIALARIEERGHTRVAYVSLYYRPVDHGHPEDSRTMEITLPSGPPAKS